jgi:hypothetical protein
VSNLVFEFVAEHKALGGIVSKVSVFEERVIIERKISGVFKATVHLPTTTTVFFKDISGIIHNEPSLRTTNIGWIEFSGVNRGGATIGTVDVNGKVINNIEITNAIKNPYCIVFNKDSKRLKDDFSRLYDVFVASKEKDTSGQNIQVVSEETPLDKIKKLKELLELGAITQEVFDEKKEKLLAQI